MYRYFFHTNPAHQPKQVNRLVLTVLILLVLLFTSLLAFSQWTPILRGTDGTVRAMVVYSGKLIIGGDFANVIDGSGTSIRVNGIAAWNGTAWSALGNGLKISAPGGPVYALAVFGGNLYAGGDFTVYCGNSTCTSGNVIVNRVAKWDGASWSGIGGVTKGVDAPVRALGADATYLYIGGNNVGQTSDGAQTVLHSIVRWDGTNWFKLGTGVNASANVDAILSSGGVLYVGGQFADASGVAKQIQ